ncbi:MAG: hypothetical protein P1V20_31415 [Verrucomicrobiales bacterium]|nr:hypothetical protein [Verrucomicrobiales bacterium]
MSSPLNLLLLCAALLTSCGERTASLSSTMSLNQTIELDAAFDRLEMVLQKKAPKLYASLSSGASEEEIEKLRSCLGGNRVEALERWFSRHNGATEELLPSGLPIEIDRSIEDLRILQTIPFVPEIRRNAVKILCDSAGDGFFVDVNTDTPLVFHHILEDPENPVWFGTLAEFVNYIATGFESGVFYQSEDGKFAHDESGYEDMMDNYLHLASRWN